MELFASRPPAEEDHATYKISQVTFLPNNLAIINPVNEGGFWWSFDFRQRRHPQPGGRG
jgi:hypothetical protein